MGELLSCKAKGGAGGEPFDCGGSKGGNGTAGDDPPGGGEGGDPGGSNCPSACPLVGSDGTGPGNSGLPGDDGHDGLGGALAEDRSGSFVGGAWVGAPGEPGESPGLKTTVALPPLESGATTNSASRAMGRP